MGLPTPANIKETDSSQFFSLKNTGCNTYKNKPREALKGGNMTGCLWTSGLQEQHSGESPSAPSLPPPIQTEHFRSCQTSTANSTGEKNSTSRISYSLSTKNGGQIPCHQNIFFSYSKQTSIKKLYHCFSGAKQGNCSSMCVSKHGALFSYWVVSVFPKEELSLHPDPIPIRLEKDVQGRAHHHGWWPRRSWMSAPTQQS